MALLWPCLSPFSSFLRSRKLSAIPVPFVSAAQFPAYSTLKKFLVLGSASRCDCYRSIQSTCSGRSTRTSSSLNNSIESDTSPPTGVFIKGLPECITEGHLKKAFSQFGEVVKVKIVVEKMSRQPLGSAFVWLTRKESAELAVEEMNGKFFDGRFILVKIAEPGLSKSRGRRTRYKF